MAPCRQAPVPRLPVLRNLLRARPSVPPAFVAVFCLLLALWTPQAPAGELPTVKIGVTISLTGNFSALDNVYRAGLELRQAQFNREESAVLGYRLELLTFDNRSDPERAVYQTEDLIKREKVSAIISSGATDITLAILPTAREYGIPVITPSATNPKIGQPGDVSFRVLFDDEFQGTALAKFMRNTLGKKRAAILSNRRFGYSQSIREAFAQAFSQAGGLVVADETFDRRLEGDERFDFRPVLERIRQANPEVILIPSYVEDATAILRQSLELDLDAIYCGGDAWHKDSLLYESGNHIEGAYYVGIMNEHAQTPEMEKFLSLLNQSNDTSAEISSALGYDALTLLIEALKRGSTPDAILAGLRTLRNFHLVSGPITIGPDGIQKPAYIVKVTRQGSNFATKVVDVIQP